MIRSIEIPWRRVKQGLELATTYVQAQQGQRAEQLWAEAEQVIHTIEDSEERSRLLSDLVEVYTQVEQWEQAERIIGLIEVDNQRVRTLKSLAEAYIRNHLWEQAERIIGT